MKEGCTNRASLCKEFYYGDLEGGLLYWGPRKIRQVRLRNGHLLP